MGAQWKHSGRLANASKRGAVFGKAVKEIIVAAKLGGPNPEGNFRLRAALENARKISVPRDTIERGIKRGAGLLDPIQYDTVIYEGFAPHQVPVIVECLTDNKNRTAADIRVLFRKGQLGNTGAVSWMFDREGVIEATHSDGSLDLETVAIEVGAQSVEPLSQEEKSDAAIGGRFSCDPSDLDQAQKQLTLLGFNVSLCELGYKAKTPLVLSEAALKEASEFLAAIDDHDDVHRVYTAI